MTGPSRSSYPPIADAHSDLLLELAHYEDEPNPFATRWLPPLDEGGVRVQVCALFAELELLPEAGLRQVLGQVAAFERAVRSNPERVVAVRSAADLDAALEQDRIGLVLSMEGVEALGYDPGLFDVFSRLGVRMVSLTWNRRNPFADGVAEAPHGGLSELGKALLARLDGLPVVLDLAHANERTFTDALACAPDLPVVVSHALCRALCSTPRNLSDDQLRAIAERGGVVGAMAVPLVVHPTEWTLERFVDHVDHMIEVAGVEHVGLGGDFTRQLARSGAVRVKGLGAPVVAYGTDPAAASLESALEGLAGPEDYPNLVAALRERGYGERDLGLLLSGNLLRVLRRALP